MANGDTVEGNAKAIVGIQKDITHIKGTTTKIWEKIDAQGDVRGDLDKHTDNHWKVTTIIVALASITVGSLTALIISII